MAVTNAPGRRGRAADGCDRAAWPTTSGTSILDEKVALDLAPLQVKQAETQRAVADSTVTAWLPETYQWLLVPVPSTLAAQGFEIGSRGNIAVVPVACVVVW